MAVGFQQIVVTGVVGLAAGAAVYLYYNKYFDKILGGITLTLPGSGSDDDTTTTPPTVTEFNFFARPKLQCRDDNITAAWLQQQGVKVLNFKIFYDNKFYPQVCGAPGGRYFLVATAKGDNSSEGVLVSLGFTKYASTPAASDIDPNIQIPGYPPVTTPLPLPVPEPTPTPTPAIIAAITTDKANYIVDESINVIGTGFNAAETVELRFKYRDTAGDGHTIGTAYTVTTDANGAFASSLLKALASTKTGQRYVQVKGLTSAKLVTKNITVSAAAASMSYAYLGEGDSYVGYPIYVAEMM